MKSQCLILSLLLVPALALAAKPSVESSLLVPGTITVNADGSVRSYTLYQQDKLEPYVVQIVKKTIKTWQFQPVVRDGKAIPVVSGMVLRVVADKLDYKRMTVKVGSEQFGCDAWLSQQLKLVPDVCPKGANITWAKWVQPKYPDKALYHAVGGTVAMLLRVDRDGRVARVAVKQVNLASSVPTAWWGLFRKVLADAAVKAARQWTFHLPTTGVDADKTHWDVGISIQYSARPRDDSETPSRPQWTTYIPGPVHQIPWADDSRDRHGEGGDAILAGSAFMRDPRLVLKTARAGDAGKS